MYSRVLEVFSGGLVMYQGVSVMCSRCFGDVFRELADVFRVLSLEMYSGGL